ncbi:uncharacterized protein [Henckelia pumila]|uniref:uncharacterized protein isoform X1 n=1 Tax=Henckelia pumila TaxID=405737 RepID=UPI003C6DE814
MISTSWGAPAAFTKGFDLQHISDGHYGRHLHVYSWPEGELKQTLDLGNSGLLPLEVFTKNLASSDKFKTDIQQEVEKTMLSVHQSDIRFGSLPVMVKSDLCSEKETEKLIVNSTMEDSLLSRVLRRAFI